MKCIRDLVAVFMVWALTFNSIQAATLSESDVAGLAQAPASQGPTIREQALLIPAGAAVEVRLTNRERLKGRIGDVSQDGVALKYSIAEQIQERQIAFSEIKSIKVLGGHSALGRGILWALGGIGAFFVVMIVIFLAYGAGD
jgi:hypothetical protein